MVNTGTDRAVHYTTQMAESNAKDKGRSLPDIGEKVFRTFNDSSLRVMTPVTLRKLGWIPSVTAFLIVALLYYLTHYHFVPYYARITG
ncbi:hypothetical protein EG830_12450, partial [bacterium]|nr:hypothetical protein [bacterium]